MTDRALLERLRGLVPHYDCEDPWYSCPKSEDGCVDDRAGDECNCGADHENALRLEAALRIESLQAVLDELIACKDLDGRMEQLYLSGKLSIEQVTVLGQLEEEFNTRAPLAWLAARRAQREG